MRLKFVDDLSLAECVRLDTQLCAKSDQSGPRTYHDRNGLFFPVECSALQRRLDDLEKSAHMHDMKLNISKTKVMPFNFTRKYDFVPAFVLDGDCLDVVYETRLLGLTITSDCRWDSNTRDIVQKGNSRLWFLRRLKILGASRNTLLDIYKLFCRSVLEFGAPVWSGALSARNILEIERVEKNAMRIISGVPGQQYEEFLQDNNEDTLVIRRDKLCLSFAHKCLKNEKFNSWFTESHVTRSGSRYFLETEAKTKRFYNSAIPYLTRLLNQENNVR